MRAGQGSVIPPLLANIYLHYATRSWAARWRRPEALQHDVGIRFSTPNVAADRSAASAGKHQISYARRFDCVSGLTNIPSVTSIVTTPAHRVETSVLVCAAFSGPTTV